MARQFLRPCKCNSVFIVRPVFTFSLPSVFGEIAEVIFIGESELRIIITEEMRTIVAIYVLTVIIRIETVIDLILFLLGQRLEDMEVCVDIVVKTSVYCDTKHIFVIPRSIFVRSKLYSAEHAYRIRGYRIDRLALLLKVAYNNYFSILDLC